MTARTRRGQAVRGALEKRGHIKRETEMPITLLKAKIDVKLRLKLILRLDFM